jgi:hypothetical protein
MNGYLIRRKHFLTGLMVMAGLLLSVAVQAQTAGQEEDQSFGEGQASWPKEFQAEGAVFLVYQPQLEKWDGNTLQAHAAVSVTPMGTDQPTFGTIWISARTEVDKEEGLVSLEDFKITKGQFPKFEDGGESFVQLLRTKLPREARIVSLGRMEANLAIAEAIQTADKQPVKNEPPQIIFNSSPSVLVLIDGKPALRPVAGSDLLRVINTRALILMDKTKGTYYLHLLGQWVQSNKIDGPWKAAASPPASLDKIRDQLAEAGQVDLLDGEEGETLTAEQMKVFVSTTPAELIQTKGKPDLAPIEGTQLLYVKNTDSQIFMNTADQDYYVLLSGRWFRSNSLENGKWTFVPNDKLGADFAKIPENHPSGAVLTSVAGTEEAEEAAIANSIPQTAQIKRGEAELAVDYDGSPEFSSIEDTSLSYALNAATPVIRVAENEYYSVDKGVWFVASSPQGPWAVADAVPSEIYSIPVSSPLHYVTYVRVYKSDPEYVYVGYTPGYYGTVVNPQGVVVYGSGYSYPSYVGNAWYGYPTTYGYGANFSYGAATGFAFGFTTGLATGVWSRPSWGPNRYWKGDSVNRVSFNHVNVYNRWGSNVRVNRFDRSAGYARRDYRGRDYRDGRTQIKQYNNNVFSSRDGNIYRQTNKGWDRYEKGNWNRADTRPDWSNRSRQLNNENIARNRGEARTRNYNPSNRTANSGGFSGGANRGGYRGGGSQVRSAPRATPRAAPSGGSRGGGRGGRR